MCQSFLYTSHKTHIVHNKFWVTEIRIPLTFKIINLEYDPPYSLPITLLMNSKTQYINHNYLNCIILHKHYNNMIYYAHAYFPLHL